MDGKYTIEGNDIILKLDATDLDSVLSDVTTCRDLIAPHIVVRDNKVVFRASDIKLIDPVTYFDRNVPSFEVTPLMFGEWIALVFFSILLFVIAEDNPSGLHALIFILSGILIGSLLAYVRYQHARYNHRERYRKATYAKARLLTYFYMVVMQEQTTSIERLERSNDRLNQEIGIMKEGYKYLYDLSPSNVKDIIGEQYPDGEPIVEPTKYN